MRAINNCCDHRPEPNATDPPPPPPPPLPTAAATLTLTDGVMADAKVCTPTEVTMNEEEEKLAKAICLSELEANTWNGEVTSSMHEVIEMEVEVEGEMVEGEEGYDEEVGEGVYEQQEGEGEGEGGRSRSQHAEALLRHGPLYYNNAMY